MSNRSSKLEGVHPELIVRGTKILAMMVAFGAPMLITDGLRTDLDQHDLWLKGRDPEHPGPIVTEKDGYIKRSNHQAKPDGYGHAIDCCFLVNGVASWDERLPWDVYGFIAVKLGLIWGGNWKTFVDKPHVELP